MTQTPPYWWSLEPRLWLEVQRRLQFDHRTDPKPRPDGYRKPKLSAVEALEPSQTGKVPPEPSNGLETAMEAQETASWKEVPPPDGINRKGIRWMQHPDPLRFGWGNGVWEKQP